MVWDTVNWPRVHIQYVACTNIRPPKLLARSHAEGLPASGQRPSAADAHGLCQFDPANIRSAPGVACRRYIASGWTRRLQPTKAGMSHHAKNGTAGQARGARTYFGRYAGPVRMAPVRCLPPRGDVEDATDCTGRSAASGRRGGWNGRPGGRQERLVAGGERLGCRG